MEQLPPGPPRSLRTNLRWLRDPDAVLAESAERYGEPFTLDLIGLPPFVVIWDPEAVKAVFTGHADALLSGRANAVFQAIVGSRSLLVLDGQAHLRERRMMLPPFHGERMRAYGDLMEDVAERTVATWPVGAPFATAPYARAIALEVIVRAVFGVGERDRVEQLGRALRRLLDTVTQPYRTAVAFLMRPGGAGMRAWHDRAPLMRRVTRLVHEEIDRRRAEPGDDILSLLLAARDEDGRPLDDDHLVDELLTLLVAGHETSAIGLTWALARLARDRELAERAAADAELLDAVIKETLRINPVFSLTAVRETARPVEVAGRTYPEGVRLSVSAYLMHRRPEVYPDPLAFRPERFLDEPAGTYTWIPFGGGRRRCLGASFALFELRAVLGAILRAGTLSATAPELERGVRRGLATAPAEGGKVVFEPRAGAATGRPPRSAAA
jgi:cytochrome P450 family 135